MMLNFFNKKNFFILTFTSYVFLWEIDKKININFDFRFIILLLLPFLLNDFFKDSKKKNICFYSLILIFFISLHQFYSNFFFNLQFILSGFFLLYLFLIAYYYYDLILENKELILKIFISIFLFSIIIHFFFQSTTNPEPVSCGALKNYFKGNYNFLHFMSSYSLIYLENSHLAMTAVPLILFCLFLFSENKIFLIKNFFFISFIVICFLKSSATLLIGLIISIFSFLLFESKRIKKSLLLLFLILIFFIISLFLSDKICKQKIYTKYLGYDLISASKYDQKEDHVQDQNTEVLDILGIKKEGSLTGATFYHAYNVTYKSILQKPFGWGFQNYEVAFLNYNKTFNVTADFFKNYNSKDATNNFFKITVEFGIFGLGFYFLLFLIMLSKKIAIDNKIFLFPFLITQSIRGAGYFNGGFILIVFIILFAQFKKK